MQTGDFHADMRLPYVPGRVGIMMWAHETAALEDARTEGAGRLTDRAIEQWHLTLEAVRVHGDWMGFSPDVGDVTPLRPEDPVVVMIHGILRGRFFPRFVRDNLQVVKQLSAAPGYLGGIGMADTPLTTTSLSCWRSAKESRRFAFSTGAHRDAYKVDLAEQRHATEFFVRFRPLSSEGTLHGVDPLRAILTAA